MTNSTNDVEKLKEKLSIFQPRVKELFESEIKVELPPDKVVSALEFLKSEGYSHLSLMTCVDWIDDSQFELIYILFSWKNGMKLVISTRIDRNNPVFPTVKELWPVARYYEREIHEFFGVNFEGNDDMKPLILELWDDKPPLRKDFDPLEYSKKKFPDREYSKDVIHEAKVFRGDKNG